MSTFLRLDGSVGTFVSTPAIAGIAGVDTFEVQLHVALDDWSPGNVPGIMAQAGTVPSWRWFAFPGVGLFVDALAD